MADPEFQEKVQKIRESTDIVALVERFVSLRAQGPRFIGLCPFHNEKTPSFSVNPDKKFFYCFGCHATGDAFSFLMRVRGLEFMDVARELGREVGVAFGTESKAQTENRKRVEAIGKANEYLQAFLTHQLRNDGARSAQEYLRGRGIAESEWEAWGVGFGASHPEVQAYLQAKRVPEKVVAQMGAFASGSGRFLFEGRVTFPIHDFTGKLVGFGGRLFEDRDLPKYVNTSESVAFRKKNMLFGWRQAEEAVRRSGTVVLVEGYTDVLACHRVGINNAVATLGTAVTPEHLQRIGRLAQQVVLLLDGDQAGQQAALKASALILRAGLKPKVAWLPEGLDPDSAVRKGQGDEVVSWVEGARPAVAIFLERGFQDADDVESKAQAAQMLAPLFQALPKGIERELYVRDLAERVGVPADEVERLWRKAPPKPAPANQRPSGRRFEGASRRAPDPNRLRPEELAILKEIMLFPGLRPQLAALVGLAQTEVMRQVCLTLSNPEEDRDAALDRLILDTRQRNTLRVTPGEDFAPGAESATLEAAKRRLELLRIEEQHASLLAELSRKEESGEDSAELADQIRSLARRKQALKHPKKKVDEE